MHQEIIRTVVKSQRTRALLAGAALLCLTARVHAFQPVGPDAELFATGVASFTATDNVYLTHANDKADTIWDFTPGLALDYGKNSQVKGSVGVQDDIEIFDGALSSNTTMLGGGGATASYDDGKVSVVGNLNYQMENQPTVTVRGAGPQATTKPTLINRNTLTVGGNGEDIVTDKSSVGGGLNYTDTHYRTSGYADLKSASVPVNYYYKYDPKLDLSAGFQYTNNVVGRSLAGKGIDSDDYFFNIGVRDHDFTPLLSGQVRVGYEIDQRSKGGSSSTVGVDASLSYAYSDKTGFTLAVQNGYGYNNFGSNFRDAGVLFGATTAFDAQWSLFGSLGYNHYTYLTTKEADDFYSATIGARYSLNSNVAFTASYNYNDDSSNIAIDSFQSNVFVVSASVRY
jgi:hypothetical protein